MENADESTSTDDTVTYEDTRSPDSHCFNDIESDNSKPAVQSKDLMNSESKTTNLENKGLNLKDKAISMNSIKPVTLVLNASSYNDKEQLADPEKLAKTMGSSPMESIDLDTMIDPDIMIPEIIMESEELPPKKTFQCAQCKKFFAGRGTLNRHIKIHTGERPYKCTDCEKSFITNTMLLLHKRTHTGERPFLCAACGKCCRDQGSLNRHSKTHADEKPYQCSACGKQFTENFHLKAHYKTHTGERPYECSKCGKSFAVSHNLRTHFRIHTGEKPFQCSKCGKCFSDLSCLNKHHKTHTGEKPYQCSECGMCFIESSNLTTHIKKHTGERPFQCNVCGRAFITKSHLKRHFSRLHEKKGEQISAVENFISNFTYSALASSQKDEHMNVVVEKIITDFANRAIAENQLLLANSSSNKSLKQFECINDKNITNSVYIN